MVRRLHRKVRRALCAVGLVAVCASCAAPVDPALKAEIERVSWRQAELARVCAKRDDLRRVEEKVERQGWLIHELDRNLFATQRMVSALEKRVGEVEDDLRDLKRGGGNDTGAARRVAGLTEEVRLLRDMLRDLRSEVRRLKDRAADVAHRGAEPAEVSKPGANGERPEGEAERSGGDAIIGRDKHRGSLLERAVSKVAVRAEARGEDDAAVLERAIADGGDRGTAFPRKGDLYAVQLASFERSISALRFWAKLPPALRERAFLYRAGIYRTVRCGPFESRAEAARFLERVRVLGYDAAVVPVDRVKYEERRWFQVGIFGKRELARKWREIWRLKGFETRVVPLEVGGEEFWRVLVHVVDDDDAARVKRVVSGAVPVVGL